MSQPNFIEMDIDTWWDTYKPKTNPIDPMSSYDGCLFETYGSELEFIRTINPNHIWTLGDGDDGDMYICNGYSVVNRIGYFITEIPCQPYTIIQIQVSSEDE